jgi:hypothetical protein
MTEEKMKKMGARIVAASAEPMVGSPTGAFGGIDVSALYIDMLCEKFKNRGIKTGLPEAKSAEIRRNAERLGIEIDGVSAYDAKYRTMKVDGKNYMSSDDFAAYYKDLRGNKLPSFITRAENEYKEAEAVKNVQESGKPPKKAVWLAIKRRTKDILKDFFSVFVVEELRKQSEEVDEGEKTRIPRGIISAFAAVALSLLMIVCSSVMVSRASGDVSKLEKEIERLEAVRDDLAADLEVKNDMLEIKRIAVEEYGMISGDYANSKYVDVTEEEKIEIVDTNGNGDNLLLRLLKAIGLVED